MPRDPGAYAEQRATRAANQAGVLAGPQAIVPEPTPLAPRRQRASLGVMGLPGSGKTYAALLVACILRRLDEDRRPIVVIDIQHGQVTDEARTFNRLYGADGPIVWLDWLTIDPTVHPRLFLRWCQEHADEYAAIIVDPFSRVWTGTLALKEALTAAKYMGGDEYAAWKPLTDWDGVWTQLMEFIQLAPTHLIITARMKEKAEKIGSEWTAIGNRPQWREETTFELGVALEVLRPTGGKYQHQVWRTRGDQPFAVMTPGDDLAKFATAYHGWLAAADAETVVTYANPVVAEGWAQIAAEWKAPGMDPKVKARARELLILAGLLSDAGVSRKQPALNYTPAELRSWVGIVERARTEIQGTTVEPPVAVETDDIIDTGHADAMVRWDAVPNEVAAQYLSALATLGLASPTGLLIEPFDGERLAQFVQVVEMAEEAAAAAAPKEETS